MKQTPEDKVKKLESLIKKGKSDLDKATKALEKAKEETEIAKKANGTLPPGFKIYWWHRHDPFESMYALSLHGEQLTHADNMWFSPNTFPSDEEKKAKLYDYAWGCYNMAKKVFPNAG